MRRAVLIVTLLAALTSGCGGDEEAEFRSEYRPLDRQVRALGEDVGHSISRASGKSDKQIESQFERLSNRTGALKRDVAELEPPGDLEPERDDLVEAMGDAEAALHDIEKAAGESDATAARQATIQLVAASKELSESRRTLERATAATR